VIKAIGETRTSDAKVIRALAPSLGDRDKEIRFSAGHALGEIGVPALPELERALREGPSEQIFEATRAVRIMKRQAAPLAPALVEAARREPGLVGRVRTALLAIGPEALPALEAVRDDEAPQLRRMVEDLVPKLQKRAAR
jgi:HEAT repeat protein